MAKRMLIDATHAEETRVVVLDGNRLEDYDVETAARAHLKGNIYLAKVVRVEPSLQACFVEYGGGRHGFLAFGEIHPDYYQIPVADRQRLLEMQAEDARREEEEEDRAAAEAAREESEGRMNSPTAMAVPEASSSPSDTAEEAISSSAELSELKFREPEISQLGPQELVQPASDPDMYASASSQPLFTEIEPPETVPPVDAGVVPQMTTSGLPDSSTVHTPTETPQVQDPNPTESGAEVLDPNAPTPRAQPLSIPVDRVSGPETRDETALPIPVDGEQPVIEGDFASIMDDESEPRPAPEMLGGDTSDDASEEREEREERRLPPRFLRNYKIQEVIKRRQILLIQVVKEERGTKGAALTTYISLAGRYCVLMPNSPRGGGISRKITSAADRRRLKEVTAELDLPKGMGLIVRTAGANRPKPEITRDCEYLLRQWDDIRETTMRSVAPALIYEEANLIKRVIRDVYSRDVDEVVVEGQESWKAARDYMRMLMPSHARKVILWQEPGQSLFARHGVEAQLDAMLSPTVQLKSGGYLVINQAEALVAIDVNSGRSTRERNIEETALRTNLEAADEVARQLRLRDLAGLIVIDFIDMDQRRHNGMVERRLKDALKNDRARIQLGSISHFGLLEMSRQRLRPSLAETTQITCPHCNGTGHVRGTESAALHVLRHVEEEGSKRRAAEILVHVAGAIALYILNNKRQRLAEIEARFGMRVSFAADETLIAPAIRIDRVRAAIPSEAPAQMLTPPPAPMIDDDDEPVELEATEEPVVAPLVVTDDVDDIEDGANATAEAGESVEDGQRRRRRRRRRGRRDDIPQQEGLDQETVETSAPSPETGPPAMEDPIEAALAEHIEGVPEHLDPPETQPDPLVPEEDNERGNRRRGRRGGRRRRRDDDPALVAVREPGAEQPDIPIYTGPTPADPFGGQAFDIFDVLERAEQAASNQSAASPAPNAATPPASVAENLVPAPIPEDAFHGTAPIAAATPASEPGAEPSLDVPMPPTAVPQQAEMTEAGADTSPAAAPAEPEPEARAEPVVKPIIVGVDEVSAAKKRGWWRR